MENNDNTPQLSFDEEKLNFLLEHAEKLHLVMTPEQINILVSSLKDNLEKIDETIISLKGQKTQQIKKNC